MVNCQLNSLLFSKPGSPCPANGMTPGIIAKRFKMLKECKNNCKDYFEEGDIFPEQNYGVLGDRIADR